MALPQPQNLLESGLFSPKGAVQLAEGFNPALGETPQPAARTHQHTNPLREPTPYDRRHA